jgi:hypothetical protein
MGAEISILNNTPANEDLGTNQFHEWALFGGRELLAILPSQDVGGCPVGTMLSLFSLISRRRHGQSCSPYDLGRAVGFHVCPVQELQSPLDEGSAMRGRIAGLQFDLLESAHACDAHWSEWATTVPSGTNTKAHKQWMGRELPRASEQSRVRPKVTFFALRIPEVVISRTTMKLFPNGAPAPGLIRVIAEVSQEHFRPEERPRL